MLNERQLFLEVWLHDLTKESELLIFIEVSKERYEKK